MEFDTEKQIRRISMRKVFNALGIEHDGRFAVCPRCGKRSLRYIQNANRVVCRTCFKRPATNIDLVMRVRKCGKADAMDWLRTLTDIAGRETSARATAHTADIEALRTFHAEVGDPYAHLCAHHNHKAKFRHDSIAVTHALALCALYAHGAHEPVAGVRNLERAALAQTRMDMRFLPTKRMQEAKRFINTHFYSADIRKTQMLTKMGELFCQHRNLIVPLRVDGMLVGLVAVDTEFRRDAAASIVPVGRFACPDAESAAITCCVDEAITFVGRSADTWLPVLPDARIETDKPTIRCQRVPDAIEVISPTIAPMEEDECPNSGC